MKLSNKERAEYLRFAEDVKYQASMYESSFVSGQRDGEKKGLKKGLKKGEEKGLKKGRKEGLKKGSKDKAFEIAGALKKKGININTIVEVSGLSAEEIKGL